MNYYINQSIHINLIKINAIANSSVFQIGSAGIIKPVTKLQKKNETVEKIASDGISLPFKVVK